MSHIIIDGYNVIGIFHKDMEKARNQFINLLIDYKKIKGHDITVVFDGYKSGASVENTAIRAGVKIIYSKLGDRADDVIKRIISKDRKQWIVITSDRDIADYAWQENSIPIRSERFYDTLLREIKRNSLEADKNLDKSLYKDFDDPKHNQCLKGSPHKLSKKEKAIKRALSKL